MSGKTLPDIRSLDLTSIRDFLGHHKELPYRAGQLYEWLWKKKATSFDVMTNLPAGLRQLLSGNFTFHRATETGRQKSKDGTEKVVFRLHDGLIVEGVLIPADDRLTVCISSQVGCALGCKFCATGQLGFTRNLLPGEIADQVTGIMEAGITPGMLPSNIVFMGMGEPFLNYQNVTFAIGRMTAPDGWGMSPQRITVSSIGIPKMIRTMTDDQAKYHFALSLHAASDEKRGKIMPFNLRHPLKEVSEALVYYHQKTGRRITVEYILFGGFNDSLSDARDLALFCRKFPVKINLIEYNPVRNTIFTKTEPEKLRQFANWLEDKNMVVNVRMSRGKDIDAACGQLAGKSSGIEV